MERKRLLFLLLSFFFFSACLSLSKPVSLSSETLEYKLKWVVDSSPILGESRKFSSLIFLKKNHLLRLDLTQPFIGSLFRLILREGEMILQEPLERRYYRGAFRSQSFFPDFPAFPPSWLALVLRGEGLKSWECEREKKRALFCRAGPFEIFWQYKNRNLKAIRIKGRDQRQIKVQIQNISKGEFSEKLFFPELKGWQRVDDPLFFQKPSLSKGKNPLQL